MLDCCCACPCPCEGKVLPTGLSCLTFRRQVAATFCDQKRDHRYIHIYPCFHDHGGNARRSAVKCRVWHAAFLALHNSLVLMLVALPHITHPSCLRLLVSRVLVRFLTIVFVLIPLVVFAHNLPVPVPRDSRNFGRNNDDFVVECQSRCAAVVRSGWYEQHSSHSPTKGPTYYSRRSTRMDDLHLVGPCSRATAHTQPEIRWCEGGAH